MALVEGTSAGICASTPSGDPDGTYSGEMDKRARAQRITTAAGVTTITEIGWYCNNATEAGDYEMGLYSDAGNDEPETRMEVSTGNAKGTTAGWKTITGLNWSVSASTTYWIAIYCEDVATRTDIDLEVSGGSGFVYNAFESALPSDWGTSTQKDTNGIVAIYCKVSSGGTSNVYQINIGDDWKEIAGMQINIGDTWKAIEGLQINIGDVWKTIF